AALGKAFQVMAITHQPQVAALGTQHLRVEKHSKGHTTQTQLTELSPEARHEELARMLAGSTITDEARAAAEKLMAVTA
ncbi:MAG: DNA repair protein RecN, partial [Rickettsiales bacterium]|nr:DNA repair protein RecN [Rickettsiales bacterium]